MNLSNPKGGFVPVNGIRLHYLDWGGSGPTLLFLTGMGCSAYIFNRFAPRFTDRFRVLALTRRGQGDSDYPETGYDADTLIEDIRQFMDQLQIQKASLAGHSLAGVELTQFAATYPERVETLIYLDALDDRREESKIVAQNPLQAIKIERLESTPRTLEEYIANIKRDVPAFAEIWSELWDEEISYDVKLNENGVVVDRMPEYVELAMIKHLVNEYAPKPVKVKIPVLSVYVQKKPRLSAVYSEEQKAAFHEFHRKVAQPFFWSLISEFQSRFPHAQIMVIPNGHHYCFIAQEDMIYNEMRRFLQDP